MSFSIGSRSIINETIAGEDLADLKSYCSDKNFLYVPDSNNGAYSNQILFDLTSAVSQNAWMSLQEGYVLIPFQTSLAITGTTPNAINSKMVALKDNFINWVDSLQLFVNGKQLVDQTTLSNLPLQIIDKLQMGASDLKLEGSALNIAPDTATSIRQAVWSNSGVLTSYATGQGDGIVNNACQTNANTNAFTDPTVNNVGLQSRMFSETLFTPAALPTTSQTTVQQPAISTPANVQQILSPYFAATTTSTVATGTWSYVAYLPLRRMSDLLRKYPLVKGSQVRLIINFNAGSVPITLAGSTNATLTMAMTSNPTMTAGNTMPAMITSNLTNGYTNTAGSTSAVLTTKIATSAFNQLPQTRVYLPTYKINPTYEERLLAPSSRFQTVKYLDWYQQPILSVAAGSSFSQTLTTALPNVACLFMVPFQGANLYLNAACPQFQSPFDTAPATTLPFGFNALQNFNVQVSGQNVFNINQSYTFDNWVQEVQKVALNAGLDKEITSGLLDYTTWTWSPVAVCDLTDRAESANDTYQSVVVSASNGSNVPVSYYCFIGYFKTIKIDTLTGDVEKIF